MILIVSSWSPPSCARGAIHRLIAALSSQIIPADQPTSTERRSTTSAEIGLLAHQLQRFPRDHIGRG